MSFDSSPSEGRRRRLRATGAVLWGCVGLALIGVWLTRRADHAAAQGDEPENVIRVEPDEEGKIHLDQALRGTPGESRDGSKPTWDPNGIEDFSFTNCDGRTVTRQDLLGKPWVASFVFTNCLSTCPMITRRVRELQDRLKREDVRFVTFTVDPKRDTPEVLKNYAELNGADLSRWYFLWGEAIDVYGLIHRGFQMPAQMPDEVTGNYQVIHSNNIMLVDQKGVVQGKYLGTKDEDMAKLARDIRRLLHPTRGSRDAGWDEIPDDAWFMKLPAVNASLNGLATALLAAGFLLIKRGRVAAHRNVMLAAFAVSIAFLASYVLYHAALQRATGLHGKEFAGSGAARFVYLAILVSHVLLAMTVPVLAVITIYRAWKKDWAKHRRIAKITWPIWMYVSVTGVIIYGMLYHWPGGGG